MTKFILCFGRQMITFTIIWISLREHRIPIRLQPMPKHLRTIGESADKFGRRCKGQIKEIVEHKNLTITFRPSSNSNRRYLQPLRDHVCNFTWYPFEHQCNCSRSFQSKSTPAQCIDRGDGTALNLVATHTV